MNNKHPNISHRVLDLYKWNKDILGYIGELNSHLIHWVLSPNEMRVEWKYDESSINCIHEDYISVMDINTRRDLYWNPSINTLIHTGKLRVSIVIKAPIIINPQSIKQESTHHLVIDAKTIPKSEREVIWLLISPYNIHEKEVLEEIIWIGNENNLPIYNADNSPRRITKGISELSRI